jgi:PAS domain S-box-containing protein
METSTAGLQKKFRMFLYGFIAFVWIVLAAKAVLYRIGEGSSLFLSEVVESFLLVTLFPAMLLYFYRKFTEHMARQEEQYEELFRKNPHAMWVYDMKTLKFLLVNDAAVALYGYTPEEFLGMRIQDIRPYDDVPALMTDVEKNRESFDFSYSHSGVWRHKKKNGALIYAEVSSYTIIFNGQRAALVLSYDVTEKIMQELRLQTVNQELEQKIRERTQDLLLLNKKLVEHNKTIKTANHDLASLSEELRVANDKIHEHAELKNRFISMVSHEFRTPLATIRFAAEYAARYHARITPQQLLDKVNSISRQVIHMEAMLNDVLTIGRNDSDKIKPIVNPLDLHVFIQSIVNEVVAAAHNSHEIVLEMGDVPEQLHSDEKLLRNIFINLLNNAVKYSPESRTVHLRVHYRNNRIVFEIQDYGMGMETEDLPRIFEPFYRTAEVKHMQGTGLGLSIVKRAVELVGGTISVESVRGNGTTFTVSIPAGITDAQVVPVVQPGEQLTGFRDGQPSVKSTDVHRLAADTKDKPIFYE